LTVTPHRTLWVRAGGTISFLLIAGVVAARLLSGSAHPILWNDQDLTPLDNSTAQKATAQSPAHLLNPGPGVANVTVKIDPIAPAAHASAALTAEAAAAAAAGWSGKGPFWGRDHLARLTSTSGHKGKGGGGGHAGTAGTGGLSRVPKADKGKSGPASVHHGGGGSTTIIMAGPAVTDPAASLLFATDTTLPTTPTGNGIGELGGALGTSGGLSLTPEPTSLLLAATGLLGLFGTFARRTRQR
jgi:hypothetical protein